MLIVGNAFIVRAAVSMGSERLRICEDLRMLFPELLVLDALKVLLNFLNIAKQCSACIVRCICFSWQREEGLIVM